jgi:hypothetical protein
MKRILPILILLTSPLAGWFIGGLLARGELLNTVIPGQADISAWFFLMLFLLLFIPLAVHELGHLLTGLFHGHTLQLFVIGPLGIKRDEQKRIIIYFNKELQLFGGAAATLPDGRPNDPATVFARILIAGPLTSVAFTFIMGITAFTVNGQPWTFYMLYMGLVSLAIALATTVPARTGIFYTDRKRYQRLRSNGIEKEIELALLKVSALRSNGQPVTSMPESELRLLTHDDAPMFRYIGYHYLCEFHSGHPEMIASHRTAMKEIEPLIPRSIVQAIEAERRTGSGTGSS